MQIYSGKVVSNANGEERPRKDFTCPIGQVHQVVQEGVNTFDAKFAARVFQEGLQKTAIACILHVLHDRVQFRRRVRTGQDLFRSTVFHHQLQYFFASDTDPEYFMFCINEHDKGRTYYEVYKIEKQDDLFVVFSLLYEATNIHKKKYTDPHGIRTNRFNEVRDVPVRALRQNEDWRESGVSKIPGQFVKQVSATNSAEAPVARRRSKRLVPANDRNSSYPLKEHVYRTPRETSAGQQSMSTVKPINSMVKVYVINHSNLSQLKQPRVSAEPLFKRRSFCAATVAHIQPPRQGHQSEQAVLNWNNNPGKYHRESLGQNNFIGPPYPSQTVQNVFKYKRAQSFGHEKPYNVIRNVDTHSNIQPTKSTPRTLEETLSFSKFTPPPVVTRSFTEDKVSKQRSFRKKTKYRNVDTTISYTGQQNTPSNMYVTLGYRGSSLASENPSVDKEMQKTSSIIPVSQKQVNRSNETITITGQGELMEIPSSARNSDQSTGGKLNRPSRTMIYSSNESVFRQPLKPKGTMYLYITKAESDTEASQRTSSQRSKKTAWRYKESSDADTEVTLIHN